MAERRGLPTKIKSVTRLNKQTGKLSLYRQAYHVSAFTKTPKEKGKGTENTVAEQFNTAISERPRKERSLKLVDFINKITPSNGEIGIVATNNIIHKLRNLNDTKTVRTAFFDKIFNEGFFNNQHAENYNGLLKETSRVINNLPPRVGDYSEIVSSIVNNRHNITDNALSSLVSSFKDHKMLVDAIRLKSHKSESYEKDELLHDFFIKFTNPINQMGSYLRPDGLTDTAKSSIQSIYGVPNDLKYINNTPSLTDSEIKLWESFINEHNTYIHNNMKDKELYKKIMVKMSPLAAATMFKSDNVYDIPIYQSTLSQYYSEIEDTNLKTIKDLNLKSSEDQPFKTNKSKFVIDDNNNVFLHTILSINELYYKDFVSLPNDKSGDAIDLYSKKSKNILKENSLSYDEINKGVDAQAESFNKYNDNSFVTINT